MLSKILIANHGEIAIRIILACKELGAKTMAVYSEADQNEMHVQLVDEAILVGAASPSDGVIKRLMVKQEQTVEREQILVEIVDALAVQ